MAACPIPTVTTLSTVTCTSHSYERSDRRHAFKRGEASAASSHRSRRFICEGESKHVRNRVAHVFLAAIRHIEQIHRDPRCVLKTPPSETASTPSAQTREAGKRSRRALTVPARLSSIDLQNQSRTSKQIDRSSPLSLHDSSYARRRRSQEERPYPQRKVTGSFLGP